MEKEMLRVSGIIRYILYVEDMTKHMIVVVKNAWNTI